MLAGAKVLALVILPLGDSITEGVPTADGYRGFLHAELERAGMEPRFVGSLRSTAGAHEGWSGYTTDELLPPLRQTLARVRPDVVLLHIGTNDLGTGVPPAVAADNVRKLLEAIDERSRKDGKRQPTRVFLARIIGRNLGPGRDRPVEDYNARLDALAAARRKAGQPVQMVDMHAAVDVRTDLDDALHPNERGYRKMASAWAKALAAAYR